MKEGVIIDKNIIQAPFTRPLILASTSPRRQELLERAGLAFTTRKPEAEEISPPELSVADTAMFLAKLKAASVSANISDEVIIGADTIVHLEGIRMGKPANEYDAARMLTHLSGRAHWVITGVCLLAKEKHKTFFEESKVFFRKLTPQEIQFYIERFKPYDKAGAYAVQEWIGHTAITRIEGCFYNVMGLPVSRLYRELQMMEKRGAYGQGS